MVNIRDKKEKQKQISGTQPADQYVVCGSVRKRKRKGQRDYFHIFAVAED